MENINELDFLCVEVIDVITIIGLGGQFIHFPGQLYLRFYIFSMNLHTSIVLAFENEYMNTMLNIFTKS